MKPQHVCPTIGATTYGLHTFFLKPWPARTLYFGRDLALLNKSYQDIQEENYFSILVLRCNTTKHKYSKHEKATQLCLYINAFLVLQKIHDLDPYIWAIIALQNKKYFTDVKQTSNGLNIVTKLHNCRCYGNNDL